MADFAYSQSEMEAAEEMDSGRLQALINFTGGLVSVVLIAGMVAWGWQLLVRDVSGVPVVEALEGPMRVEPDDPGGVAASHQGLAVNRIAEGQEAAPAADRIVLAPPPVELAELQPAAPVERPLAVSEPDAVESVRAEAIDAAPASDLPTEAAPAETAAIAETVPPATDGPTPEAAAEATLALIDRLITEEAPEFAGTGISADIVPISVSGVRSSLLPAPRPAALVLAAAEVANVTETATDTVAAAPSEIDPAGLAPGTWLVQLGAYDDAATARSEWDRLASAYGDFFTPRNRIVQEAVSGGRRFYRLRAHGFEGLMDARRFCSALLAEGSACIPVAVR